MVDDVTEQGTDLENVDEEGAKIERLMDREERGLGNELIDLAIEYKRAFRERIRDQQLGATLLRRELSKLRSKFEPRVRDAIASRAETMRQEAREITLEENSWMREALGRSSVQNASFEDSFQLTIDSLAREVLHRMEGAAEGSYSENARQRTEDGDDQALEIDRPADSTLEGAASETGSTAVAEGRDDVADEAKEALESQDEGPSTVYAVRTSVLDSNTCGPCEQLHGEQAKVGSDKYSRIAPPARCEGHRRCRCYFRYLTPGDAQDGGAANVVEQGAGEPGRSVIVQIMQRVSGIFDTSRAAPESADDVDWKQFEQAVDELGADDGSLLIYTWGTKRHEDHPAGAYTVDEEWAGALVDNYEYLLDEHGDRPPILLQHQEDGLTLGHVDDLQVTDDGVAMQPALNRLGKVLVYLGAIDRLSGSQYPRWTDPETGVTLGPVLYEVSAVSREHLKSLPRISQQTDLVAAADTGAYEAIRQEGQQMPTDLEADGSESVDQMSDEDKMVDQMSDEGDGVENMPSSKSFGGKLKKLIDASTTPEGMPGPDAAFHMETIADAAGMSAGDLEGRISDGSLMYPSDALMEGVAEWLSGEDREVTADQIRTGEVSLDDMTGGDSGGSESDMDGDTDTDDEGPTPPTPENAEPAENAAPSPELEQARRRYAREKLKNLDVDDAKSRQLVDMAARDLDQFDQTVDLVESAATRPTTSIASDAGEPIGVEHGAVGSGESGSRAHQVIRKAKEADKSRGREAIGYIRGELDFDGDLPGEVFDEIYQ